MLLRDETHAYSGHRNTPSRCRVRLYLPAEDSGHDTYIVVLTDGGQTDGTNTKGPAESLAAPLCAKFNIPPERTVFIEHHEHRRLRGGHDDPGRTEDFSRVVFAVSRDRKGGFEYLHRTTLGKPDWKHTDRQSVEQWIDCHLS